MKNGKRRSKTEKPAKLYPPKPARTLKAWHVIAALFVAGFVLLEVYGPAINGPFLFDDNYLPFADPHYKGAPLKAWVVGVRPVLMFCYWLSYKAFGLNPQPYHLVSILLHFLNGLLVFLIVAKLLEWAGAEEWRRRVIAAFAGALFLLHPLQSEAVAYIASQSETLSVFFFYAAWAAFLYRRKTAISFPRALAVVILFGVAVASKEHTAVLPLLLLLTDYYWNPGFSFQGIKRNWRLYIPVVIMGALGVAFILDKLAESDTAGFSVKGLPWYLYFATQMKAIWIYVRLFVFPVGQNIDHDYAMAASLLDPGAIAGFLALLGTAAAAWWYRRRAPLLSYGFFTFLLLLSPTSSVVPIKDMLVERRVYLPSAGLLLIVAGLLLRWKSPRRVFAGTLAGVVLLSGILCHERNKVWASPLALWEDSVAKAPENARARFQLAFAYYDQQRCQEAVKEYASVARLQTPDYRLLVDWALALDCAGHPEQAVAKLKQAAGIEKTAHVYSLLGMMYGKQGLRDEALAALAKAEKINRRFPMLYVYRGNVYASSGDNAAAVTEYRRALRIAPDLEVARRGLQAAERRLRRKR